MGLRKASTAQEAKQKAPTATTSAEETSESRDRQAVSPNVSPKTPQQEQIVRSPTKKAITDSAFTTQKAPTEQNAIAVMVPQRPAAAMLSEKPASQRTFADSTIPLRRSQRLLT